LCPRVVRLGPALLMAWFLVLTNCGPDQNRIQAATAQGDNDGREAGSKAGYADGFAAAFPKAHDDSYAATLKTLYDSDRFQRKPPLTSAVLVVGFLVGFGIQYILLYLARRRGLPDIDRILLSRDLTQVSLTESKSSGKRKSAPFVGSLLVLTISLPLLRCANPVEEAYKQAYDVAYKAAYPEGHAKGESQGNLDGTTDGATAAQRAADQGEAWQLYWRMAVAALGAGILLGLSLHYAVLAASRRSGRLDHLQAVVWVPAIKRSLSYSIFQTRLQLKLHMEEALQQVSANSSVQKAELEAAYDVMRKKIQASSSLADLTGARIVEFADEEFSRIISSAQTTLTQDRSDI
jgi:hypothetical protein